MHHFELPVCRRVARKSVEVVIFEDEGDEAEGGDQDVDEGNDDEDGEDDCG